MFRKIVSCSLHSRIGKVLGILKSRNTKFELEEVILY